MKLQYINNACVLIKGKGYKLLFDPWIYGHLYNNKWRPEALSQKYDPINLNDITHIFISHLHQDHWDIDTLKVVNKKSLVLIPDFPFNRIISSTLKKYGFTRFKYINTDTFFELKPNIFIKIIPQLNDFGQDLDKYELQSSNPYVSFDTSLLIHDKKNQYSHLLLGDNTPYNTEQLKKSIGNLQIDTLWFPFNGFADDYPLCYENLSIRERQNISKRKCLERETSLLEAFELIDPKYVVPHSSDFLLSGKKAADFKLVHDKTFRSRYLYSKRLKNIFKIPAVYLGVGDEMGFSSSGKIILKKRLNIKAKKPFKNRSSQFLKKVEYDFDIAEDLSESFSLMKIRCKKYNIDLSSFADWDLEIDLIDSSKKYVVSFSDNKIFSKKNKSSDKKILSLKISRILFSKILNREIHLNNSIIGNELSWERVPNIYNQNLYNALNFLHK